MIAREVTCGVYLNAGREVGVASTKCFTSQVIVLGLIACWFAQYRDLHEISRMSLINSIRQLPYQISSVLTLNESCKEIANRLVFGNCGSKYESIFILGRGNNWPLR